MRSAGDNEAKYQNNKGVVMKCTHHYLYRLSPTLPHIAFINSTFELLEIMLYQKQVETMIRYNYPIPANVGVIYKWPS